MLNRIEVGFLDGVTDAVGQGVCRSIHDDLHIQIESVRTIDAYVLEMDIAEKDFAAVKDRLFTDPVIQVSALNKPLASNFDFLIAVSYKPGVTDNIGRSAREGVMDILGRTLGDQEDVYVSRQYLIRGKIGLKDARKIAADLLANNLIESHLIISQKEWEKGKRVPLKSNRIIGVRRDNVDYFKIHELNDEALVALSTDRVLSLTLAEMKSIRAYYCRSTVVRERKQFGLEPFPTDVELEALAQTWSEHCKHKIFSGEIDYRDGRGRREKIKSLFKTYIQSATMAIGKKADWLQSVFTDNAGIIRFNKKYSMAMKVETHNSPSALDPYGGAMTGIVGVNRDIMGAGKGCKPIFNTDIFCFASPYYEAKIPPGLLHPRRVLKGVHRGVKDGGNESGIPTVNGSMVFDRRFLGKPLVFCGTGGLIPAFIKGQASHVKHIDAGDLIVMVGGRIGKDGIHGATFSSVGLTMSSPMSAVQIGDPITQKKMLDMLLEARDMDLYKSITDNGAGGLSSSVGEMANQAGGAEIELSHAPLKYQGLLPWEILLSEAQERMTVGLSPDKVQAFISLAKRRGVEATVIGHFTDTGKFIIKYRDKVVGALDLEFMHSGFPVLKLKAEWKPPIRHELRHYPDRNFSADLLALLKRENIASKETWLRQYDHEVQGMSVIKPFTGSLNDGPSDAAVLKPLYDSNEGLAVSHGIVPRYGDIDTYHMTACAIDEALRSAVCVGARPDYAAGLDNFCWPDPVESVDNPDGRYKLAQLVRSNKALYTVCKAMGVPCISGKDSMKNDYGQGQDKISIPPTLLFSLIAKVDDVRKCITMDVKRGGDLVYVLGVTRREMGGSEFLAMLGQVGNSVPKVRVKSAKLLYMSVHKAIQKGLLASCHDCSDGGLAVAMAEASFAGGLGMKIQLEKIPVEGNLEPAVILYAESQSRFVATVSPRRRKAFEKIMKGHVLACVGAVTDGEDFIITHGEKILIRENIKILKKAWQEPLGW